MHEPSSFNDVLDPKQNGKVVDRMLSLWNEYEFEYGPIGAHGRKKIETVLAGLYHGRNLSFNGREKDDGRQEMYRFQELLENAYSVSNGRNFNNCILDVGGGRTRGEQRRFT